MERLDAYLRAVNASLQECPEAFNGVCVNITINVLHGVVNDLMRVISGQSAIGEKGITYLNFWITLSHANKLARCGAAALPRV